MRFRSARRPALRLSAAVAALAAGATSVLLGLCGPFTDVTDPTFCGNVLEIYFLGITTGTTPTTYFPGDPVTRLQMAAFLSREADRLLLRGSQRAALKQFWSPQSTGAIALTTVGALPLGVRSDGADVWVSNFNDSSVSRVRAGDGSVLQTWTGLTNATGLVVAMGSVFVAGEVGPGRLYRIDPSGNTLTTVASNLGNFPQHAAFDGLRIWATGQEVGPFVSIVTPGSTLPWTVTTVTAGFAGPFGILYDGANVWITDTTPGTLLKLDVSGAILQTVTVGTSPFSPAFDGTNIWVPNAGSNTVSVIRASSGAVLTTLTGNSVNNPVAAAFDGQRILVVNYAGASVSVWKAADFSSLGSVMLGGGTNPIAACSDGTNFWIALSSANKLARF